MNEGDARLDRWQVMNALYKTISRSIQLSELMKAKGALHYLRFGAARRLLMLWHAYRNLLLIVSSDRKEPLTSDESCELIQDLNVIYVNICGALDNLCWALLHEHAPDKVTLSPSKVGLFLRSIVDDDRFASLARRIKVHDAWDREVKGRRHPATHRIPLSVAPQVVTPEEAANYKKLCDDYSQALGQPDSDRAEDIMRRMGRIGRFVPYFIHDPEQGLVPIYPTVPDDIGHVIDLFAAVEAFLLSAASSAAAPSD